MRPKPFAECSALAGLFKLYPLLTACLFAIVTTLHMLTPLLTHLEMNQRLWKICQFIWLDWVVRLERGRSMTALWEMVGNMHRDVLIHLMSVLFVDLPMKYWNLRVCVRFNRRSLVSRRIVMYFCLLIESGATRLWKIKWISVGEWWHKN